MIETQTELTVPTGEQYVQVLLDAAVARHSHSKASEELRRLSQHQDEAFGQLPTELPENLAKLPTDIRFRISDTAIRQRAASIAYASASQTAEAAEELSNSYRTVVLGRFVTARVIGDIPLIRYWDTRKGDAYKLETQGIVSRAERHFLVVEEPSGSHWRYRGVEWFVPLIEPHVDPPAQYAELTIVDQSSHYH